MYQRSEGRFKGYQEANLFFQRWKPPQHKGTLIITHGHGEHSSSYARLVDGLGDLSLDIFAWDLRGHGKSEGLRGYAQDFTNYIQDFELFLKMLTTEKRILDKPVFLLAHSMGALIQERLLCERPNLPITAQILASPMFGIALAVPAYKSIAAKYLSSWIPKLTMGNEIPNTDLSRDTEVLREYDLDNLRHDKMSSGVFVGSQRAMSEVFARAARVHIPTLLVIPEQDPVTSSSAAKEFFDKISSEKKEIGIYADRRHEIFNDLGREEVFADIRRFLSQWL